ncbi:hypothetical protein DYQ05_07855 [Treponema pedis]|nr:hypothetical protein DYQ05_07855 [Treponema pedis]
MESIKYFETGLNVNDKTYKAHLTVKEVQDTDNKAYHYYLDDVTLEDILIDRIKKEAALRTRASSKEVNAPLLHGSNTNISENAETVNSEKQQKSKIDEAYDKAAEAARLANEESIKQAEADKKDSGDILFQTEVTKEELNEIEDVRKKYEGTEQWLKAPDGSNSNLNEKQWLQVRTDSFKKWFGDWESDSENKVLDDNGEPLVVYHGSPEILGDVFEQGHSFYGGNLGHWFTTVETAARDYAFNRETGNYGDVKAVFLKTNKIIDLLPLGARCTSKEFCELMNDYGFDFGRGSNKTYRTNELYQKYQNDILPNISYGCIRMIDVGHTYVVKGGNQIKSATDNTGSFDPDNYSILFQTAPLTEEEKAFKEAAAQYRKDINRYFAGEMKSNETVTVCKTTPTILRAAGFEDKPITVSGATLKHITDKHKDITQDILSSLPEQLLNPVAVFKSQNKEQSNSRLIFTEHFVNGKPVLAALEMNYETDHAIVNSIRSVYERDITAKSGWNVLQGWIDSGNLLYVDDKRADEWSATTGVSFPLRAFSKLNPSSNIIGENAGNVNTVLTKSSIIGDNADALYLKAEKEFYDEVTAAETKQEVKENLEKIIVGKDITEAENLFYLFVHL